MQEMTVGEWIENLRGEQKISKKQLCHGLCSTTALTRYEEGMRFPNRFLLEYFFQRLGKNIAVSDMILDSDEFNLCTERNNIENDLNQNLLTGAKDKLNLYQNKKKKSENIHAQYVYYTRGRIHEAEMNFADAKSCYLRALSYTDNEDYMDALEKHLLSKTELEIIHKILLLSYRRNNTKYAMSGFLKIQHYIENHNVIDEIRHNMYPEIILKNAEENLKIYNYGTAQEQTEKAVEILRKEFKISNLLHGIHLLIELAKNKPMEDHFEGLSKSNTYVALSILDIDTDDESDLLEMVRENKWENIIEHL